MDVRAITDDGTGALRVKRYFVHSTFGGVTRNLYNSSNLSRLTDKEFKEAVEEAASVTTENKAELLKTLI
jgi:hypothetical protein